MKPLVTIIVVSYNHSQFIKENLDSIKNQTYSNIQLIVADDASQDNSVEVFENWLQENNYTALKNYHKKNTGLATTLNESIALATGKYIKLIAADDFLHEESIELCVKKLEELGDNYGMVFTDTFAINNNSEIVNDIADYNSLGNIDPYLFQKELIKGNRIAALTVLMKTSVLKETGPYDSKFIVEDYYRWLKINEKYLIAYIPNKLAYYRQHDSNISQLRSQQIQIEDTLLRISFDKKGICKQKVNSKVSEMYLSNIQLPKDFINKYNHYPHKVKRLSFALKYRIPSFFYNIFLKRL